MEEARPHSGNAYVRIEEHSHGLDAFIQRPTHTLQVLRDRHMSLGIVVLSVRLSWHVSQPTFRPTPSSCPRLVANPTWLRVAWEGSTRVVLHRETTGQHFWLLCYIDLYWKVHRT